MEQVRPIKPHEKYRDSRPQKGEYIKYRNKVVGKVTRVEENICHIVRLGKAEHSMFIWCFRDGLNALHEWRRKKDYHERAPTAGHNIRYCGR